MDIAVKLLKDAIEWIYGLTGDYGVAIVLITVAVRLLLVPLNAKQRAQMEKQQELSARVEQLKEKYRKDPQKMNEELQKLYREKGIGGLGCLTSLIQLPVMMCLYQGIRLTAAAGAATVLLPWVSSLLVRDQTFLLPAATLTVQFLPQLCPYLRYFRKLNLQKMTLQSALILLFANSMFVFMIPSGVGLYYFVSGLFSAGEQITGHILAVRRMEAQAA